MLERTPPQFRELQEITMQTDTRDILAHATRQAESYEDCFLVDIDAHVTETSFWPEILASIDNDVIRQMGQVVHRERRHKSSTGEIPDSTAGADRRSVDTQLH